MLPHGPLLRKVIRVHMWVLAEGDFGCRNRQAGGQQPQKRVVRRLQLVRCQLVIVPQNHALSWLI